MGFFNWFAHGIPETSHLPAQFKIGSMGIGDKPCMVQIEFSMFIHILVVRRHAYHFRQE